MSRAPEKRLFTPKDPALYPLRIETIAVDSAGLVSSGDMLLMLRVADGRRMAMRAPMAGRMLRILVTAGETIEDRACVMTMRDEPGLVLAGDQRSAPIVPDAPWGNESYFDGFDDGFIGADWQSAPARTTAGAAPHAAGETAQSSGAALGRITPVKRAAMPSPAARVRRKRYSWIRRNSGEHEAEAPHSKRLWAGLAGMVLLLFLLGAIPREFYEEPEDEIERTLKTTN